MHNANTKKGVTIMNVTERISMYKYYNSIALRGEIVVYGSTYMANFPFYELSQKYLLSNAIYNRSVEGLDLKTAEEGLQTCVIDAAPDKVFLALGEQDIENPCAIEIYERILTKIQDKCPHCKIYVFSIPGETKNIELFNKNLKQLATQKKVNYVEIQYRWADKTNPLAAVFKQMLPFFRNRKITMMEAFAVEG